jgi:epoxyqueuosine reductase
VQARLDDDSSLVRGAAVWALSRLIDDTKFQAAAQSHLDRETDPDVRSEWAVKR